MRRRGLHEGEGPTWRGGAYMKERGLHEGEGPT